MNLKECEDGNNSTIENNMKMFSTVVSLLKIASIETRQINLFKDTMTDPNRIVCRLMFVIE